MVRSTRTSPLSRPADASTQLHPAQERNEPEALLESLLDNLTTQRIAIDMIEFSGIEFRQVDNRLMSMKLVQMGLSGAAMFDPRGTVLQPAEVLYKKNVLVERGSFRPICHVNVDML